MTLLDRPVRDQDPATAPLRPRPRQRARSIFLARQLVLLLVAVATYFGVRGLTVGDTVTATGNAHGVVALERILGIFVEQPAQAVALDVPGAMTVLNAIYIYGHWPVIAAVLVWLALRRPGAYPVYRDALLLSGLVGMAIVALHPVAPPRLMDLGFIDTVTTRTNAYRVLQPPQFTNPYAAMPSFHAGWDLLVGIALVRESGNRWMRVAGRLLPPLMVMAVVLTGNHYFLDVVAGDAIVIAALLGASWWHGRRRPRTPPRAPPEIRPRTRPRPLSPALRRD
ncbi:phosphatase PAP2 family protein [Nocardioides sp. JQ2195]|uniref:phosphatase PAP2 family protein n=1 Tax=Nocardioides sp. JQ2195 TaxID=2592334 RepID=UPI00143EACCD|nr:phosphatase PAP2 family protein [Nocardioides sp. JQ2195]QIX27132.1 phosphatase PAP2 family protein [Nocardioides sp. JQ2195]